MEKEITVDIELTPEQKKFVKAYAAAHNMSVSDFIVECVRKKIESPEEMVNVEDDIPVWMDRKVQEQNIDLSEVLQKALISILNKKGGE